MKAIRHSNPCNHANDCERVDGESDDSFLSQSLTTSDRARALRRITQVDQSYGSSLPPGSYLRRTLSQLELRVVLEHHSHARLREAATARLELGLLVDDPLIVLVHRLQGVTPWNHAAYCWHTALERDATRDLLSSAWPAGRGLVLQYVCTSACDPSVRINRRFKLDWGFSSALHSAVRRQASIPFDGVESVLAIARLGLGSVDGEVLAARAVVRTTVAG